MPLALIAEFDVAAKDLDPFLAAGKVELAAVREKEPGCLRFDIIVYDEGEGDKGRGRGAFVEVFADQAAADHHYQQPHFKAFFDAIDGLDVQWTMRPGTAVG